MQGIENRRYVFYAFLIIRRTTLPFGSSILGQKGDLPCLKKELL